MELTLQPFSTDHTLAYFTDAVNIPNQELVSETIQWFSQGPGARVFVPLTILNLLQGQLNYIFGHKADLESVKSHLANLPLNPLQKHVLYGLILKWTGGYPVNNLDEQTNAVLKVLESEFVAFPEATPEKEFCKADLETSRKFRRFETLFNTHFQTGVPLEELSLKIFGNPVEPTSALFKSFPDLYKRIVDLGILPTVPNSLDDALRRADLETRFQDWLNSHKGWHYADVSRLPDYLTLDNFSEFLAVNQLTQSFPSNAENMTKENSQVIKEINAPLGSDLDPDEIFVTYSWEDEPHNERVISLTEHLRKKEGFNAHMDRMILVEQTAADLNKMMYSKLRKATKVIVVLTKGYKQKADNYLGGVGIEYSIILKDIEEHPQKYILVSFEEFDPAIVPFGFKGRMITSLTSQEGMDELIRKLGGAHEYEFSPVAESRRTLPSKPIADLQLIKKFAGDGPEVGNEGPWDGLAVRKAVVSAIENNDTNGLKNLLQQNSFLFYDLVARKDFQQPVFYDVPLGPSGVVDFVWLNDNSDGPEWVLVKVAEPEMAVMEGSKPSQALSQTIETLISWERYLANQPNDARAVFGAIVKLRLVVVAGSIQAWEKTAARGWRADNNKNGRVEVRSSNVFIKAVDYYLQNPGEFYGPRQYPQVLSHDQLKMYWSNYGYMQQMIKYFGS